ncbi:MAG: hypothetical protein ACI4JW_08100 [Oscillospiraceae bacterium]
MIFAIIWVILPIILIPLAIWAICKKNKLEAFVKSLLMSGRIDNQEFMTLRTQDELDFYRQRTMQQMQYMQNMQNMQNIQNIQNVQHMPNMPNVQSVQNIQSVQNVQSIPVVHPKPVRKPNTAGIMLIIGVVFIILAGVVFSSAAWLYMNDWQRTGIIAAAAAFFLGVSVFAHKKLKLENTGLAFYMLGSTFAAITFATAGYFGLFGEWLSTDGGGRFLLFSLLCIIVGGFSFGAVRLYKRVFAVHTALYSLALSVVFIAVEFFDTAASWTMFLNIVSAALLFGLFKIGLNFGEMYDKPIKIFSYVITGIYAAAAVPSLIGDLASGWNVCEYITVLLWLIQLTAYGIVKKNSALLSVQSILAAFISLEVCVTLHENKLLEINGSVLLFAAIMLVLGLGYNISPKLRTPVSDFAFPIMIFFSAFFSSEDGYTAAVFAMLAALTGVIFLTRQGDKNSGYLSAFKVACPLFLLASGFFLSSLIANSVVKYDDAVPYREIDVMTRSIAVLFGFAIFAAVRLVPKFKSRISEALIIAFTVNGAFFTNGYETLYSALASAIALVAFVEMLIAALDKKDAKKAKVYTYLLSAPVILSAVCGANALKSYAGISEYLTQMLVFLIFGTAFTAVKRIRTTVSDFIFPAALVITAMSNTGKPYISALCLFSSVILLAAAAYTSSAEKNSAVKNISAALSAAVFVPAAYIGSDVLSDSFGISAGSMILIFTVLMTFAAAVLEVFAYFGGGRTNYSLYCCASASVLTICFCANSGGCGIAELISALPVFAAIYFLSTKQRLNICAILPAAAVYGVFIRTGEEIYALSDNLSYDVITLIVTLCAFALLFAASRRFYSDSFILSANSAKKGFDCAGAAMFFAPLYLMSQLSGGSDDMFGFAAAVGLALSFTNLVRKKNSADANRIFSTLACGFGCFAIFVQPFFEIENDTVRTKIDLIPLILFGLCVRYIWREKKKFAADFSFIIHLSALIFLILDALINQSMANTLFVLITAAAILFISFFAKNLRWFTASAATLAGLTLYITRDYLAEIDWWIYLLIVGVLLISTAAVNEYLKTRGESLRSKAAKAKSRWKKQ